jgi:5-methylcytosine-specific restriction protein A
VTIEERRAYGREQYRKKKTEYIARAKASYERNKKSRLAYIREWQVANPEKLKRYTKKYRDANKAACRSRVVAWENKNPEKCKAIKQDWQERNSDYTRQWRRDYRSRPENIAREKLTKSAWIAANIERARMQGRRDANARRARLANVGGTFTAQQALWRIEYFGWHCVYCKKELTERTVTLDHQIPICRGGTDWPSNLVPACKSCNSKKHKKTAFEYQAIMLGAGSVYGEKVPIPPSPPESTLVLSLCPT